MKSLLRRDVPVEVLMCEGDLNAQHMVQLGNKMTRLIGQNHRHVLLDLRKARYVDLAGLGILVQRLRRFREMRGDIRLCNIRPKVAETLRLVGLNGLIESYNTQEEALESFRFA